MHALSSSMSSNVTQSCIQKEHWYDLAFGSAPESMPRLLCFCNFELCKISRLAFKILVQGYRHLIDKLWSTQRHLKCIVFSGGTKIYSVLFLFFSFKSINEPLTNNDASQAKISCDTWQIFFKKKRKKKNVYYYCKVQLSKKQKKNHLRSQTQIFSLRDILLTNWCIQILTASIFVDIKSTWYLTYKYNCYRKSILNFCGSLSLALLAFLNSFVES